jgi:TonB family protein
LLAIISLTLGAGLARGQGGTGRPTTPPPKKTPPARKTPRSNPTSAVSPPAASFSTLINARALEDGIVSGEIAYSGPAPRRFLVDTSADPLCTQLEPNFEIEEPIVRRGKAANVFVYLKDGVTDDGKKLSDLSFAVPTTEVVLSQKGCRFFPHVFGVMVNQAITINNGDPTTHNVHFAPKNNPEWNQSQVAGGAALTHRLELSEVMVLIKNNQHPWMKAYAGALNHPFFAVTQADGKFEIRGVPPGTYTLAAWHEGPGGGSEMTLGVIVKGSASLAPKTLEADPALFPPDKGNLQYGDPKGDARNDPAGAKVYSGKEVDQRAQILSRPKPIYTDEARKNLVSGTVVLKAVLASNGQVANIRVIKGLPNGLTEQAIAAAKELRFVPAMKDGHAVSQEIQLEYNFNPY